MRKLIVSIAAGSTFRIYWIQGFVCWLLVKLDSLGNCGVRDWLLESKARSFD